VLIVGLFFYPQNTPNRTSWYIRMTEIELIIMTTTQRFVSLPVRRIPLDELADALRYCP